MLEFLITQYLVFVPFMFVPLICSRELTFLGAIIMAPFWPIFVLMIICEPIVYLLKKIKAYITDKKFFLKKKDD